jgi:hypothetical protein
MKILTRNSIHKNEKSHDCLLLEIGNKGNGGKICKITYEAHNAVERCNAEIFDGTKWNHIFSIMDLGIMPESSAYNIWNSEKRKTRADELFKKAEIMLTKII